MQLSHYLILKLRVKIYDFLLCNFHCGMSYKQTADYDIVTIYDGLTGDLHKTRPLYKSDKMNARFTLLLNVCFASTCTIFGIAETEHYRIHL